MELTKPFLVAAVPDIDVAITPTCGKCVVVSVECDCVDWEDVFDAILLHSVTFESILPFLSLWAGI